MSYVTRVLPPDEWPRLAGTEAERLWPHADPVNTRVIVVEQEGRIVGAWVAMRVVHAECVWIAEDHRHAVGIVRRLIMGMRRIAHDWCVQVVLTTALTPSVERLCQKLGGVAMPGTGYALPMSRE